MEGTMFDYRKMAWGLIVTVLAVGLTVPPELAAMRPIERKPNWWLRDGICFVGNWEPLEFRIRLGRVPHDWRTDWEFRHSKETIDKLYDAGINMVLTHFYKGMGLEHESESLEYTHRIAGRLRANGQYVGGYVGSTLFSETLYAEVPGSDGWKQLDRRGEPIVYGDQYFRERADFTTEGYRNQIKEAVRIGIEEYDLDLIHFDNFYTMFPMDAGYTEHIQQLFREYLENKYTPEQRKERLGFATVSHIRPPQVAKRPMEPVPDPLVQEWIVFRVEKLTGFIRELSEYIRTLSDKAAVEFNPHGIWGQNSAYTNGMDHPELLALSDMFWSEDPDHAHYFEDDGRLVSKIRSFKLGRRFGNALFSYNRNPLELAEAMAFNRMCIGDVTWEMAVEPENWKRELAYIRFFHDNKELFRDLETLDDVGVMRDFESLTFGGWTPFLSTVQAEQALIQSRAPFTLLFERDWENLKNWKVVVLAAQENLSDREIALAGDYVHGGGSLVVVGKSIGAYDSWRRERRGEDRFWNRLGLPSITDNPDSPARERLGRGRVYYLPAFQSHEAVPRTAGEVHPDFWYLPLNNGEFLDGVRWAAGGNLSVEVETMPWVAASQYRKGGQRQVHLVNYRPGYPVRHVPVVFGEPGFKPERAKLYSPDHEPVSLDISRYSGRWSVIVPEVDIYGVVVVE
jgi:hypothetical protein